MHFVMVAVPYATGFAHLGTVLVRFEMLAVRFDVAMSTRLDQYMSICREGWSGIILKWDGFRVMLS